MEDETPEKQEQPTFQGFRKPKKKHFFSLPNEWTDITADIDNLPELKIIEYVIRHTWGFQNYDTFQDITVDEFMHGRKHRDGSRMDKGTGLSETGAKRGIARALEHEYILCDIDASDLGRITKSYKVKMFPTAELEDLTETPEGLNETSEGFSETAKGSRENPRTEKETFKDTSKRQLEKKDPLSFTPEELLIFQWCVEDAEYEPKIEAKNKGYCATLVKKGIATREQYNALRDIAKSMIRGEDKTVYLGNMASVRVLNAWEKQSQQTPEPDENEYWYPGMEIPGNLERGIERTCKQKWGESFKHSVINKAFQEIEMPPKSFETLFTEKMEKADSPDDVLAQMKRWVTVGTR